MASAAIPRRIADPAPHQRAVRLSVTGLPTEISVLFRKERLVRYRDGTPELCASIRWGGELKKGVTRPQFLSVNQPEDRSLQVVSAQEDIPSQHDVLDQAGGEGEARRRALQRCSLYSGDPSR